MNDIFREINDLTAEMDKLQKIDDDVFIRFYEKVDELQEHLDGVKDVTMDLAAVEYISSGGLRMMQATEQLLEQKGGALKVINANEYILEVFDLVGFMDVVEVVRS